MVALEAHEAASAVVVCVDDDEEDELDVLMTGCCGCGDCTVDMNTFGTTGVVAAATACSSLARLWCEIVSGVANSMTIGEESTIGELTAAGEIEELLLAFEGGVLIAVVVVAVVAVVALFKLVFILTLFGAVAVVMVVVVVDVVVGEAASSLDRLGAVGFCVRPCCCCCGGLAGIFSLFTSLAIDGRLVKTGGGCCCCWGGPGCLVILVEFVLNSLVLVVSMKLWVPAAAELAVTAEFTDEEPT